MHISEKVLDNDGKIDPYRLDAVARLGGDYYARVQGDSIFTVPKPLERMGIGIDSLPEAIRMSSILTGSDLARLANVEVIPPKGQLSPYEESILAKGVQEVHKLAQQYLRENRILDAWRILS
jgi:hypothetical protein